MKIISQINKSIKILSLTAAFGLSFSFPAFALDGNAFFASIQSQLQKQGHKIEASNIAVNGANINIPEAKITVQNNKDEVTLVVTDLAFNNVVEAANGDYAVEKFAFKQAKFDNIAASAIIAVVQNVTVNNIIISSPKNDQVVSNQRPYDSLWVENITFDREGQVFAVLDDLSFAFPEFDLNKSLKWTGKLGNARIDLASFKDGSAYKQFMQMGFKQLELQGDYSFAANLESGDINIIFYSNMNDAGRLDIAINLAGLTKDVAEEFIRLSKLEDVGSQKEKELDQSSLLGLMQQLSLNSLSVKFDDNSITNKVLDLYKGDDVDRKDFVTQLKMFLPLMLAQLKSSDFEAKVNEQLSKYLDNPDNIEIVAKPEKNASFIVIGMTAMTSPKLLIDLLNVEVKANQ